MFNQKLEGFRFEEGVIGFGGEPTLWWMHFLKKGFYHCLIALKCENQWLLVDPLIHCIDMIMIKKGNIHYYLKRHGYKTIDVKITEPNSRKLKLSPFTCVETVKRIVGIQQRLIFTPFALYCYLNKKRKVTS